MIKLYDSIAALRAEAIATNALATMSGGSYDSRPAWFDNETCEQTLRKTEVGDTSLVPNAERLLTSLETAIEVPHSIASKAGRPKPS